MVWCVFIGGKVEIFLLVKEYSYGMIGLLYLSNLVNLLLFKKFIVKFCKMVFFFVRMYFFLIERIFEVDSNLLLGIFILKV